MQIIPNKLGMLAIKKEKSVEDLISEALANSNGNVARAASLLGISRQALSQRLNTPKATGK